PQQDSWGNVFIIGLQRSGTTLAYQLIARTTDVGYINNLIARFWENPAYGIYLCRHLGLPNNISFESTYGTPADITDVHEFDYFWASLFIPNATAALADIDPEKIDWPLVRNKVLSINRACNKPCAHKNTLIGHVLGHFARNFERKLFVYVRRDFLEIAH